VRSTAVGGHSVLRRNFIPIARDVCSRSWWTSEPLGILQQSFMYVNGIMCNGKNVRATTLQKDSSNSEKKRTENLFISFCAP